MSRRFRNGIRTRRSPGPWAWSCGGVRARARYLCEARCAIAIKAASNHTERSAYRARRNANQTQINVWEMGFMMYPSNPIFLIPAAPRSDFGPDLGIWYATGGAEGGGGPAPVAARSYRG